MTMPSTLAPDRSGQRSTPPAARRREIEGLRGFAVALVIVFHVWIGRVSGGVDAFLFISGYFLIPSLITSYSRNENLLPWQRLRKVLWRLWVPMLVLIVVTLGVAVAWVYPLTRQDALLGDAIASAGWWINWHLGLSGNEYAAATATVSPFQHLWSMAVQAQVFAALIVGLWVMGVFSRRLLVLTRERDVAAVLITTVSVTAVVSFAWAMVHTGGAEQTLNYYSTVSRFWEIAIGGVVGILASRWKSRFRGLYASLAAFLALAVLSCSGFLVNGVQTYPGVLALIPIGATALLILAMAGITDHSNVSWTANPVYRALSTPLMVGVGARAYVLYLVHWPVLVSVLAYRSFHKVTATTAHAGFLEGILIIAISIILAEVLYRLIAEPVNHQVLRFPRLALRLDDAAIRRSYLSVIVVVTLSIGVVTAYQAGREEGSSVWNKHSVDTTGTSAQDYPGARAFGEGLTVAERTPVPSFSTALGDVARSQHEGCFSGTTDPIFRHCVYGDPSSAKMIALVGGSHSDQYLPAFDALGKKYHIRVETVFKADCPLAWGNDATVTKWATCPPWRDQLFAWITTAKPSLVITTSTRPVDGYGRGDYVPDSYRAAFERLSGQGINVLAIRDNPWIRNEDGSPREPVDCLALGKDARTCGTTRAALSATDPADSLRGIRGVSLADNTRLLCDESRCPAVIGNVTVYRDSHHFTATFVLSMQEYLEEELIRAFPAAQN